MAHIASDVNVCCYRHVPYDVYVIDKCYSTSFGRRKMPNVLLSHWTILFSSISLLSMCILRSGFLYIVFYEHSDHMHIVLNCIHSYEFQHHWVAVVTPTDRPKSVRNCCLIELFCGVVCVVTLPFWHFCWCRGFCHRTGPDLLLFVFIAP